MYKLISLIILSILLFSGCKTSTEPVPPEKKPPGYQEDVPWASLADSPWPMNHHDPQSTGRSKYIGPQSGIIAGKIPAEEMQSSIAIGMDSTIYFSTSSPGYIHAVDYNGEAKWDTTIGREVFTTPLISEDGTVYICSDYRQSLAFTSQGKLKWKFSVNDGIWILGMNIGLDGIIYFIGAYGVLYAVDKEGKLKWKYEDERFYVGTNSALTFSPDGKVLYIQGYKDVSVLAFNIETKSVKWTFGEYPLRSSPIVDAQGNIYFSPGRHSSYPEQPILYSLSPEGKIRWSFIYSINQIVFSNTEPTIDKDGNIYFGIDTLYSLNYEGKLRWKFGLGDVKIHSPLISDAKGNVYLGLAGFGGIKIMSVSSEGKKIWEIKIEGERETGTSPVITEDGTLYYPTFRSHNILIIK
jgi:outer membrane protein assembly factor BamB